MGKTRLAHIRGSPCSALKVKEGQDHSMMMSITTTGSAAVRVKKEKRETCSSRWIQTRRGQPSIRHDDDTAAA